MDYLYELNAIRKKIWIKTIAIFIILIILCFLPILFIKNQDILDCIKYILIFGFGVYLCGYWISKSLCKKDIESYKKIYAKSITLKVLESSFKDVKYKSNGSLPEDFARVINEAKIPTTNSFDCNDYFSATYKNIKVEYCDIVLSYTPRNSEDNIHDVFKGKWLVLSFKENFKSNIQIGPRIFNGKKNSQMLKGNQYKKININDEVFNKNFIAYSDNENELFNVLTTKRIEKLKDLYDITGGKVFVFFVDNKIHIGIGDKKNFFEPSIYKKFDLENEKKKMESQIKIITKFIDGWI